MAKANTVGEVLEQLPATQVAQPPVPVESTIFSIVERAARDPSVDIDKLDRLLLMQERVQAKQAELEFDNAMAAAQAEMQPVRVDSNNPSTRSKYASYAALDNAIRPIYAQHGFSLSFDTADGAPAGDVRIICKVAHRGGHRERPRIDMPADGKGAKGGDVMTRTHAMGSAVTYGKRYLLGMIFNLATTTKDDDDGNAAGRRPSPLADDRGDPTPEHTWTTEARNDGLIKNGETRSTYQINREATAPQREADAAQKAKEWTDSAIGTVKLSGQTPTTLGTFWRSQQKAIDKLQDKHPKEYERFLHAYNDALEAARALTGE